MLNPPRTLKEARKYKYEKLFKFWAPYKEGLCAWEVLSRWKEFVPYQCSRKNGYGPNGLYCKQHAKKIKDK